MQVLRHMNQLLDRHPQSRRRGLTFNALTIVPVWPQVDSVGYDVLTRMMNWPLPLICMRLRVQAGS